jgi:2,5-diketo-D-gluconate reductase B
MTRDDGFRLGLGTYQNSDPERCASTVAQALEVGYRHIDTAQMYGNEAAVGEGIRRADVPREDVFVATKVHPENLASEDVVESTRASLDRLGLETVDLLYVHWPVGDYDPEGTLAAFDELRASGAVRHVGLSNFTPELLDEAIDVLEADPYAHQVELHPFCQQRELQRYAREHDHWLAGYCPLARGGVFGNEVLADIADEHGASEAQVVLAWHLSKETVAAVPKATGDHVAENLAAVDLELTDRDVERIDALDRGERFIDDTPGEVPWE